MTDDEILDAIKAGKLFAYLWNDIKFAFSPVPNETALTVEEVKDALAKKREAKNDPGTDQPQVKKKAKRRRRK